MDGGDLKASILHNGTSVAVFVFPGTFVVVWTKGSLVELSTQSVYLGLGCALHLADVKKL